LAEGEAEAGPEPTGEELLEQVRELKVGQFLYSACATLASLAYGKLEAGELDELRLSIDAMRAVVPLLEGQIEAEAERGLRQVVANLQVAYADAVAAASPPDE
jgi:hypothetical protein